LLPSLGLISRAGAFVADAQSLHPAIKMRAVNSQRFRCVSYVAVAFGELSKNVVSLISLAAFAIRSEVVTRAHLYRVRCAERRQVFGAYSVPRRHYYHSLDSVSYVANAT